jgi:hypothetical protein
MNASLSEYLFPLIILAAFVLISVRKGKDKKNLEEMEKTMLPGRKSGDLLDVPETAQASPVQKKKKKPQQPAIKPLLAPVDIPVSTSVVEDGEADFNEPVLDIEDMDNIKKAVIYTEIFKRKDY